MPPDTRIGAYQLLEVVGAGGMGIVYRARDLKLRRDVALKVLPDAVALDPDRIARFGREAHVLASLNRPNIAAIHGFEGSGDVHALVLELVEGPTLADRIAQGAMPSPDGGWDIGVFPIDGDRKLRPIVQTAFVESDGQFSIRPVDQFCRSFEFRTTVIGRSCGRMLGRSVLQRTHATTLFAQIAHGLLRMSVTVDRG
jgi:hypothetical protein